MPDNTVAILDSVTRFLDRQHGLYIDGKWCDSLSDARLAIYNPATANRSPLRLMPTPKMFPARSRLLIRPFAPVYGHNVCPPSASEFCCATLT